MCRNFKNAFLVLMGVERETGVNNRKRTCASFVFDFDCYKWNASSFCFTFLLSISSHFLNLIIFVSSKMCHRRHFEVCKLDVFKRMGGF